MIYYKPYIYTYSIYPPATVTVTTRTYIFSRESLLTSMFPLYVTGRGLDPTYIDGLHYPLYKRLCTAHVSFNYNLSQPRCPYSLHTKNRLCNACIYMYIYTYVYVRGDSK